MAYCAPQNLIAIITLCKYQISAIEEVGCFFKILGVSGVPQLTTPGLDFVPMFEGTHVVSFLNFQPLFF